ncbi:uncharacterized protein B0J16DRAFT_115982 [Fusarium flagelliforme]|uniref:uncharacterized protein n=1 Tax=Fusarium flagelliforme TaxID=2675880 RepID=UPI001E8E5AD7|nr:uncharacterized protein B0J16DRAFT_115982 [Fusarium flagelliforme]KAH7189484.1 hypothetical protein B0J16DRAFT_115982 [Fusarium flagelliforme]
MQWVTLTLYLNTLMVVDLNCIMFIPTARACSRCRLGFCRVRTALDERHRVKDPKDLHSVLIFVSYCVLACIHQTGMSKKINKGWWGCLA